MRYLLDGYNLAYALGLIRGKVASGSLELIRKSLLQHLMQLPGTDPGAVTIVFDAQRAPAWVPDRQQQHGFTVLFSRQELADDLIEDLVRRETQPTHLTVVSDDHRVREAARRRGCHARHCLDFVEALMRPARPVATRAEQSDKPDTISEEETLAWLRRFNLDEDDR
jgi:predicted RNA-binding protein with PIN domain